MTSRPIKIKRDDIFLANLDPTVGSEMKKTRPVVIISDNEMNTYLSTVVVCPLTTTLHPAWRTRVPTQCAGRESEIALDQIRTIARDRLVRRLDRLPTETAGVVRQRITEMYGTG